jgi:diaminopimelate epimerase
MNLVFEKYQGTGNDFVVIDDRKLTFPETDLEFIVHLCHRKFGVGSDGLMLIRNHPDADFEMVFFNPDGSRSLCGNGSRCAVHFAERLGLAGKKGTFITTDGAHDYEIMPADGRIAISMHNVSDSQILMGHMFIHTGSPHLIVEVSDVDSIDVFEQGRTLRYDGSFQSMNGVNVNFVEEMSEGCFGVRTYERGVENETLSCGTGVTAVALAMALKGKATENAEIHTHGGVLEVQFHKNGNKFTGIRLIGPVQHVFSGVLHA